MRSQLWNTIFHRGEEVTSGSIYFTLLLRSKIAAAVPMVMKPPRFYFDHWNLLQFIHWDTSLVHFAFTNLKEDIKKRLECIISRFGDNIRAYRCRGGWIENYRTDLGEGSMYVGLVYYQIVGSFKQSLKWDGESVPEKLFLLIQHESKEHTLRWGLGINYKSLPVAYFETI